MRADPELLDELIEALKGARGKLPDEVAVTLHQVRRSAPAGTAMSMVRDRARMAVLTCCGAARRVSPGTRALRARARARAVTA